MLITIVMALMTVMSVMPMKDLMTVVSGMYMMILKNVTTVVSMIFHESKALLASKNDPKVFPYYVFIMFLPSPDLHL